MSLSRWIFETYFDQMSLENGEGSRRYKAFVGQLTERAPGSNGGKETAVPIRMGGAMRANAFDVIKYGFPLHSTYQIAVMEMQVNTGSETLGTTYGAAYWPIGDTIPDEPEYICVAPTYNSQDGEYRPRFIWGNAFRKIYADNSELCSRLEERALELIRDDKLSLNVYIFPEPQEERFAKAAQQVEDQRLALTLFVAETIAATDLSPLAPHVHPNYVKARKILQDLMADVIKGLDPASLGALACGFTSGRCGARTRASCGQKLIPLMRREAVEINNVRYPAWREEQIARWCSNMVINGRSPGFPIYNQWAFIPGCRRNAFENEAMHQLFKEDVVARAALKHLSAARELSAGMKSPAFERFGYGVYNAVKTSEELLILANEALLTTMEDVGRTFGAWPGSFRNHPSERRCQLITTQPLTKLVFDLCYNCLVMHRAAIHTDLHYNNITIKDHWWAKRPTDPQSPCMLYVTGKKGEADSFVLPVFGQTACIIDFSRALISPRMRPELEKTMAPEAVASFFREQVDRMLLALDRWLPQFAKANQEKIKAAGLSDQQELFDVLTALDYMALGRNLAALLEPDETGPWKPAPEVRTMCGLLETLARKELLTGLHRVVLRRDPHKDSPAKFVGTNSVGHRLLREVFSAYRFPHWDPDELKALTLVDACNAAAPMKYNGECVADFPPWAQPEQLVKHSGGLKITDILERGSQPLQDMLAAAEGDPELDVLIEEGRARLSERPPPGAGETWIR